jgi:tetratricopeptide (TPR) repeat protein
MSRNPTVLGCLLITLVCSVAAAQTKYRTAREAFGVGAVFYNARNYEQSREPFEAALKLAPDDKYRIKVYEALLASYRLLPDSDKMIEACEFIIEKSERSAQQSLTRRSLLGFVYQRGQIDVLAKRHEDRLKKKAKDRTSLYILSELYARAKPDPERAIKYTNQLNKVDGSGDAPVDVLQSGNLARQYTRARQYKQAAELYEKIAPLDDKLAAWNWKEAAQCWLKHGDEKRALAAAKKSHGSEAEARNDQLAHFWHRNLGDVLLATGEAKLAVGHFEKAVELTKIDGYIKGTKESLAKARKQAGQ